MKKRFTEEQILDFLKQAEAGVPEVWSMDFVFDALSTGRRIKCLTVVDDFTKESVGILVEHGISGFRVTRALDEMARFRGYPKAILTARILA